MHLSSLAASRSNLKTELLIYKHVLNNYNEQLIYSKVILRLKAFCKARSDLTIATIACSINLCA